MVTYFSRKDLVSFGNYLLSKERQDLIKANYIDGDSISLEERLSVVYHADVENWLCDENKKDKNNQ